MFEIFGVVARLPAGFSVLELHTCNHSLLNAAFDEISALSPCCNFSNLSASLSSIRSTASSCNKNSSQSLGLTSLCDKSDLKLSASSVGKMCGTRFATLVNKPFSPLTSTPKSRESLFKNCTPMSQNALRALSSKRAAGHVHTTATKQGNSDTS